MLYGNSDQISKHLTEKYKDLSSIVYVTVPSTGNDDFDNSLEIFQNMSEFKSIIIESEVSKEVLKSIIDKTKINYKKLKILQLRTKNC